MVRWRLWDKGWSFDKKANKIDSHCTIKFLDMLGRVQGWILVMVKVMGRHGGRETNIHRKKMGGEKEYLHKFAPRSPKRRKDKNLGDAG